MKYIAIIFSIIFSIISLILGQFIYPLLASFVDSSPTIFLVVFKLLILVLFIILAVKLFKEIGVRCSIILPYIISFIISIVLISIRFGNSTYNNGYIEHYGNLKNSIGIEVLSGSNYDSSYFQAFNNNGYNIIIEYFTEKDKSYEKDSDREYRFFIKVKVYDENYQFLWSDETHTYDRYHPSRDDVKESIDGWNGITIYKSIG